MALAELRANKELGSVPASWFDEKLKTTTAVPNEFEAMGVIRSSGMGPESALLWRIMLKAGGLDRTLLKKEEGMGPESRELDMAN